MSEYQYYEFAALDTPLTAQQQAELRARSSRATITPTSFTNVYHWGDLKGEPLDWIQRYFDAYVYSANWGSCRLLLRLPRAALEQPMLTPFVDLPDDGYYYPALSATRTAEHWILDWSFNDDSGDYERFWSQEDGPGWMTRLLPLRDELLRGDTRPLYLGWLASVWREELDRDKFEPPLPPGLQNLSPAQAALAEFLLIDPDWLTAAAEGSPPLPAPENLESAAANWLSTLSPAAMRDTLAQLLIGRGPEAERGLRTRFLAWQREQAAHGTGTPACRSVAQIEARVGVAREQRLERERAAREAAEVRRKQEKKEFFARLFAGREAAWMAIDASLQRGSGAAYDQALRDVQNLTTAYAQAGQEAEFRHGLVRLLTAHGKRKAWLERLNKAGLLWEPQA